MCPNKFPITELWRPVFYAVAILTASFFCSSPLAGNPKPGTLRIKTIPPNCVIMIGDSVVTDFTKKGEWLELKRAEGLYAVRTIGAGKTLEFMIQIQLNKKTCVTADLITGSVLGFSDESPTPIEMPSKIIKDSTPADLPQVSPPDTSPAPGDCADILPEMIKLAYPEYPLAEKQARIQGTVWIKTLVNKEGAPQVVQLRKSSGRKTLDEAALKAAKQCLFRPAILHGRPVACWVTYPVKFTLK